MIHFFFLLLLRSGNRNSPYKLIICDYVDRGNQGYTDARTVALGGVIKKAKLYSERHAVKTHRRCKQMCTFKRMMIMINATSRIRMIIMMMLSSNSRNNKNSSRNNNKNYQNNNSDTICNNNMKQ